MRSKWEGVDKAEKATTDDIRDARCHFSVGKAFGKKEGDWIFASNPLIFLWRAREDSNPRPIA